MRKILSAIGNATGATIILFGLFFIVSEAVVWTVTGDAMLIIAIIEKASFGWLAEGFIARLLGFVFAVVWIIIFITAYTEGGFE